MKKKIELYYPLFQSNERKLSKKRGKKNKLISVSIGIAPNMKN